MIILPPPPHTHAHTHTFKGYGVDMNNPTNTFSNYAGGGNGAVERFSSYRDKANVGADSFNIFSRKNLPGSTHLFTKLPLSDEAEAEAERVVLMWVYLAKETVGPFFS